MRRLLLILLAFTLLETTAHAQGTHLKDSLLLRLKTAKEDTLKVEMLLRIGDLYANKNYDSFYYYLDQANALSKKIETNKYDFFIDGGYAEYYYNKSDYRKSIEYALKASAFAEAKNDLKLLAKSYNNLAAVHNRFGNHKSAIDCILKCLDISERTKDSISFPIRNLTASATYYNLQQFDKAIIYAQKAYTFGRQFKNDYAVAMGLNNLAASYAQLNLLDSSIAINKRQLEFAKQQENATNINYALINLCHDFFKQGNKTALNVYAKELATYTKILPDRQMIPEISNAFALNLMAQQKYDLAKIQLDSGIFIAKTTDNTDALENLYQTYSVLYFLKGNIKEGKEYSFKYDSIIRSINITELNFYTEELETKYKTEKKESQIKLQQAQLDKKNTLNYFLVSGIAGLLLVLLLSYRNYRSRQKLQQSKIDELETEKQLAATASVLKGEEQERTRLAKDLHDGLGGMLSGIKYSLNNMKENLVMTPDNAQAFERSIDMLDSSIKEMRRVAHNMMPEMLLKYGLDTALKEFCNEIGRSSVMRVTYQSAGIVNATLEQTASVTIYRIIQELVSNALKHANAQNVLVQVHQHEQEKVLAITVEDDGKGFDITALKQAGGMGWKNIESRVAFLKGKLDIQSSPDKGTSVMIEMNVA